MDTARLEAIGLSVRETEDGTMLADLELDQVALINPLTRSPIQRVSFLVEDDKLVAHEPPELAWIPPLPLGRIERASELEKLLGAAFDDYVFNLEHRSTELQAMGLQPHVDPSTLELTADVNEGDYHFVIAADRRGNFELVRALKGGEALSAPPGHPFELSEYRDKGALVAYLIGLVGAWSPIPANRPILFREVAEKLHPDAVVPATSPVEILMELDIGGVRHRFAAARVAGRTFRGLLASRHGKVWSDRFELDSFPGVITLVSRLLGVPADQVKVVGGPGQKE